MDNKILSGIFHAIEKVGIVGASGTETDVDLCEFIEDSITFITFIVELENEFQIEFPDDLLLLETISSLYGLCEIIESLVNTNIKKESSNDTDDIYDEIKQLQLEVNEIQEEMNMLV